MSFSRSTISASRRTWHTDHFRESTLQRRSSEKQQEEPECFQNSDSELRIYFDQTTAGDCGEKHSIISLISLRVKDVFGTFAVSLISSFLSLSNSDTCMSLQDLNASSTNMTANQTTQEKNTFAAIEFWELVTFFSFQQILYIKNEYKTTRIPHGTMTHNTSYLHQTEEKILTFWHFEKFSFWNEDLSLFMSCIKFSVSNNWNLHCTCANTQKSQENVKIPGVLLLLILYIPSHRFLCLGWGGGGGWSLVNMLF